MLDYLLEFLFIFLFFGVPPIAILVSFLRAPRAGASNDGPPLDMSTLPAYNTDGTPMIPGSSFDAMGSSYGNPSH